MADAPSTLLRIHKWSDEFLTDKTRGRKGKLLWVKLPCDLTNIGYSTLAMSKDGAAHLGVWMALLEVAGGLDARDGYLRRSDGTPMTASELGVMTRLPEQVLTAGIKALTAVGWLSSESCGIVPNDSPTPLIEGEGEGENSRVQNTPLPPKGGGVDWFVDFWNTYAAKTLPAVQRMGQPRVRAVTAMLTAAGGQREAVERAIAAFASWPFAVEKRLSVDTFLRACNRDKYLEWGQTGPPSGNGQVENLNNAILDYAKRRFGDAGNLD